MTDDTGNEWMVYEVYPLINPNREIEISEAADETMFRQIIHAYSLQVFVIDASFNFDSLSLQGEYAENLESQQANHKALIESNKVDSMNFAIELN